MEATPATLPPPEEIFSGRVFLLPNSGRGRKGAITAIGRFCLSLSPSDDDAHSLLLTNRVTRPTYNDRVEGAFKYEVHVMTEEVHVKQNK